MIGDFESAAEADRRIQILDELCHRTLAALEPFAFEVAATPGAIDAALRLRYRCVVERGWASAETMPDGRERDEYDGQAIHLICRTRNEVIGCLRLVLPQPGRPLPAERHFGIRIGDSHDTVEAGRLVVRPDHRGAPGSPVMAGLFCRGWLELRACGFTRAVAIAPDQIIEQFRNSGLVVNVLGEPKEYWGELRAPVEVAGAAGTFAAVDPAMDGDRAPTHARGS